MKTNWIICLGILLTVLTCNNNDEVTLTPPDDSGASRKVVLIQDEFEGEPIVIAGSKVNEFMVAFNRTLPSGDILSFEAMPGALPVIMKDQEGNEWDIFGVAVNGPRTGERLVSTKSYIGFWFAWGTMYPGVELFDGPAFTGDFQQDPPAEDWSIPLSTVASGVGFDGIPSVDNPQFKTYQQRELISEDFLIGDDDLVIGILINDQVHLYPHAILNWHEVVNDQIDDVHFSLTFCPLTGTALAWNRELSNGVTTFGVSGLLYNSNVIPYDRSTESFWSQMREDCVRGDLIGEKLEIFPVVETTWRTWKTIFEQPTLMTTETGIGKDYDTNPYQGYIENNDLLSFPIELDDTRLPRKERVLGVIVNGKAKAYRFADF